MHELTKQIKEWGGRCAFDNRDIYLQHLNDEVIVPWMKEKTALLKSNDGGFFHTIIDKVFGLTQPTIEEHMREFVSKNPVVDRFGFLNDTFWKELNRVIEERK